MRLAVHQPNYAPWCGYFAKMRRTDVFVLLDDVQMPGGQSYVYRTRIRGADGAQWLSVPTRYNLGDAISDVRLAAAKWPRKHLGTLQAIYAKCPFFREIYALLEPFYHQPGESLAEFNGQIIQALAAYLQLPCRVVWSSALKPDGVSDERLISLAQLTGADAYLSGKGGQNYQDPAKFARHGIRLEVQEYQPVPYPQRHGAFLPGLSIYDALFHLGPEAVKLL